MQYFVNAQNQVFAFENAEEMQEFAKEPLTAITEAQAKELTKPSVEQINAEIEAQRRHAYEQEADPLFFKAQRGEATMQEWQDKIAEIKARFPKE